MNKTRLALACLLCCSAAGAFAQAAAPAYGLTVTGNAGLFSDYRFRGFSQTGYKPAFQGGFDVAHTSGFYAGNWNSNVEQGLYNGASLDSITTTRIRAPAAARRSGTASSTSAARGR
jgi:uncharacterized protein (TIGR02001 family)